MSEDKNSKQPPQPTPIKPQKDDFQKREANVIEKGNALPRNQNPPPMPPKEKK